MLDKFWPNIFEISQTSPSPVEGGGRGWGWTKRVSLPLPSIPSREGRGGFWRTLSK